MRLSGLSFDGFRADSKTYVPLSPLMLLFGANSTGKTTILELIARALGGSDVVDHVRSESLFHGINTEEAEVSVELEAVDVPGSPDRQLLRAALISDHVRSEKDDPVYLFALFYRPPDLQEELEALRIRLRNDFTRDSVYLANSSSDFLVPNAREIDHLVDALLQGGMSVRFTDGRVTIYTRPILREQDRAMIARFIAAGGYSTDWWETFLAEGEVNLTDDLDCPAALIPVLPLLADEGSITPLVRSTISELLTWVFQDGLRKRTEGTAGQDCWPFLSGEKGALLIANPRLLDSVRDPWFAPDEDFILPGIEYLATTLALRANTVAPDFVRDQGTILISVMPPQYWANIPDRVLVTFREKDAEISVDCEVLGAGVRRWVKAAVRLACAELQRADRLVEDADLTTIQGRREVSVALGEAAHDETAFARFKFEPPVSVGVVLVDEPEAHLHPKAVRSVAHFLADLSCRAEAVVVATHHPMFVDPALLPTAERFITRRDGSERFVQPVTADIKASLNLVKDEVGLTDADLLLLTRLALFVEGPHDKEVLEAFFGDDFQSAGVVVIPFHGTHNALALVDAEVFWALDIRLAVLTDHTSIDRVRTRAPHTQEERKIVQLLREAQSSGHPIDRRAQFGLNQPDILYYLDIDVCQTREPTFPGWAETWERSGASGGSEWKRWLASNYPKLGVKSRRGVRQVADACRCAGKVPAELRAMVAEIVELARSG